MKIKKILNWSLSTIAILIVVQPITYFTFAHKLLEREISDLGLPHYERADTLFVHPFYQSECATSLAWYLPIDVSGQEHVFTEWFDVSKVIVRADLGIQERYRADFDGLKSIVYQLYISYDKPLDSFGHLFLFRSVLTENVFFEHDIHMRDREFQWLLFFWLEIYQQENSIIRRCPDELNRTT